MSIGVVYRSHSTARGSASFESIPFYNATITYNKDKASIMSFKSNVKLEEADRIIYTDVSNNTTFGGQVVKQSKNLGGDYNYEVIDYTRLYQTKVSASFSGLRSSTILKKLIQADKNNLSTAGIQETTYTHAYLKWDNKSLWEIIEQLAWLEYQAGNYIYYDIDYAGNLIWKKIPETVTGYTFSEAYDYDDSHDSSDIITQGIFLNSNNPNERVEAVADNSMIAKWGYISEISTCTPPAANKTDNCTTTTKASTTYWSKCGLSPDKKLICGIGKPSAPGEGKYAYALYKSVFQNKCPWCGKATLSWGYMWSGKFPCTKKFNNGSAGRYEGHIYCDNCDADYGCITGREHRNGSNKYVKMVSKPVRSSTNEANKLKTGKLPYQTQNTTAKDCKKTTTSTTKKSIKNEANIKKYGIATVVWKKAVEVTNPNWTEMQNAKAIFNYMKKNTVYQSYTNTRYGAAGTLKRRRGNCVDHAHLFAAMCRSVGIKCNYIHNPCICHVYSKVYIGGRGIIVDTGRGSSGTNTSTWGSHWGGRGCPTEKTSLNF